MTKPGDNSELHVDPQDLAKDLDDLRGTKKAIDEANGEHRSSLKDILDRRGYHKGAMSTIRSIDDMSETKRADFMRSFLPMLDALIETRWASDQSDLPLEDVETGDEKKPEVAGKKPAPKKPAPKKKDAE